MISLMSSKFKLESVGDITWVEHLYEINNRQKPLYINMGGYFTVCRATILSVSSRTLFDIIS